jgi:hypothetical protein
MIYHNPDGTTSEQVEDGQRESGGGLAPDSSRTVYIAAAARTNADIARVLFHEVAHMRVDQQVRSEEVTVRLEEEHFALDRNLSPKPSDASAPPLWRARVLNPQTGLTHVNVPGIEFGVAANPLYTQTGNVERDANGAPATPYLVDIKYARAETLLSPRRPLIGRSR